MAGNTLANSSDAIARLKPNVWARKKMLAHAATSRELERFAMAIKMPKNEGQEAEMREPVPFDPATTPLTEGVTPSPNIMKYKYAKIALNQYGQIVQVSDKVEETAKNPYFKDAIMMAGENVGRTLEAIDWGVLTGGTSVVYANGTTRAGVNSTITRDKLSKVRSAMQKQRAKKFTKILAPGVGQGTVGIGSSYVAFCHTDVLPSLEAIPALNNADAFRPVSSYPSQQFISDNEMGSIMNMRFIMTPDFEPIKGAGAAVGSTGMIGTTPEGQTAARCDIYPIVVIGMESYAHVRLRGHGKVNFYVHPANKADKSDALGQKALAGWKTWYAVGITNQLWIYRLEVAVKEQ